MKTIEKSMHGLILFLQTSISFPSYTLYIVLCTIVYMHVFLCVYIQSTCKVFLQSKYYDFINCMKCLVKLQKLHGTFTRQYQNGFLLVLTCIYTYFIYMKIYTYSKLVNTCLFYIYFQFCVLPISFASNDPMLFSQKKKPLHFLK